MNAGITEKNLIQKVGRDIVFLNCYMNIEPAPSKSDFHTQKIDVRIA